jgi:cardiolipin synthase A/B
MVGRILLVVSFAALGCASLPRPHLPQLGLREIRAGKPLDESHWVPGNRVRLLEDGPASYRAMFDAIARAHDSVNLETYILEGDGVGEKLADLLIAKQSAGVQVNLLYDAVGSLGTPKSYFERLRDAGVNVCEFNPLLPKRGFIADPNQRDHRKQVIVDGRLAESGGINVSNVYSSGSAGHAQSDEAPSLTSGWRDTNVSVEGPAAAQYQALFVASWEKQRCEPLGARNYFPLVGARGDKTVRVVGSSADELRRMYLALVAAIRESHRSVYITMAYFVPDDEIRDALEDAARRGVDVHLILPGFSDSWVVLEAGRSYYGELLAAGVHISELHGALLHAKTAVIDDVWTTVGSTNLDWRSLLYNDELNTIVVGADFGTAATAMFENDLHEATLVDPARWRERGVTPRVREGFARLFAYVL